MAPKYELKKSSKECGSGKGASVPVEKNGRDISQLNIIINKFMPGAPASSSGTGKRVQDSGLADAIHAPTTRPGVMSAEIHMEERMIEKEKPVPNRSETPLYPNNSFG